LGTIRNLRGLSEVKGKLDKLLEAVCLFLSVVASSSLNMSVQTAVQARMDFIQKTLQIRLSTQATYMTQEKDECHEATRDRILRQLDEWLSTPSENERCWWLMGQPGVGKSAIAITVADCLTARRPVSATTTGEDGYVPKATLFSQFFINHTLSDTTNPHTIFPTIALDLAVISPVAAVLIHDSLKTNPALGHKLSAEQVDALYVRPLSAIARHDPGVVVTLLDGIDELANTDGENLSSFTSILASATARLPPNVKLLVFSRPENPIITQLKRFTGSIHCSDLLTEESREDVRRFLQAKLARIAELHELQDWPAMEHLDLLCEFAAGHLGWAALAVRWIGREVERKGESPYIRQAVFEQVTAVRKGNLYDLYAFILTRVIPDNAEEEEKVGCERVLGTLAILESPQTIATITSLLSLGDTYNVLHFFRRISSIIVSGLEAVDGQTVPQPHKSFFDWICSHHPEPRFRIDVNAHHKRLSMRCLEILKASLHFNMANIVTSDPLVLLENFGIDKSNARSDDSPTLRTLLWSRTDPSVLYSCSMLFHHIAEAGQLSKSVLDELDFFFKHLFLSWMEVACTYVFPDVLDSVHNLILVCVDNLIEIITYVLSLARAKIITS
jgi:hypothetical protein